MKPIFIIWGKVTKGKNRGKDIGFPTANISLHKHIPDGIYAAKVLVKNKEYIAATFVGASKTFQETDRKVESFLLNFQGNIYTQWITIKLFKKIRNNMFFHSAHELSIQMEKDVKEIKDYFQNL